MVHHDQPSWTFGRDSSSSMMQSTNVLRLGIQKKSRPIAEVFSGSSKVAKNNNIF